MTALATPKPPAASPESAASRFPLSPMARNFPMISSALMPIPGSLNAKVRAVVSHSMPK